MRGMEEMLLRSSRSPGMFQLVQEVREVLLEDQNAERAWVGLWTKEQRERIRPHVERLEGRNVTMAGKIMKLIQEKAVEMVIALVAARKKQGNTLAEDVAEDEVNGEGDHADEGTEDVLINHIDGPDEASEGAEETKEDSENHPGGEETKYGGLSRRITDESDQDNETNDEEEVCNDVMTANREMRDPRDRNKERTKNKPNKANGDNNKNSTNNNNNYNNNNDTNNNTNNNKNDKSTKNENNDNNKKNTNNNNNRNGIINETKIRRGRRIC